MSDELKEMGPREIIDSGHAIIKDGIVYNIEEVMHQSEEYGACMKAMDDLDVPVSVNGEELSIFGRAVWMKDLAAGRITIKD